MNQKSLLILFYLNKSKLNSKGLCPIKCRITYNKRRKEFSTGNFISPADWNSKKQEVSLKSFQVDYLNSALQKIFLQISKSYLLLQMEDNEIEVEDIYNGYLGKPVKQKEYVVAYFKNYLKKIEKLIGKEIVFATWKKYNYTCNQVEQFIQWKYNKKDYAFEDLKPQFLADFEYFLKTELNQVQVTVNKAIQRLRKPIKVAVAEGYLVKDPFALHKQGKVRKAIIFLSVEELELLENHLFKQPRLALVKDLFIFCCYTGLAYHEMSHLKKEHIVKGFDGNLWIQMKRQKTNKMISVPLLPKAKVILDKYDEAGEYALPKFSNQKINSYLKEIGGIVGINKSISHHMARKTFASTVLLYNDVPMEIVSELLGHSSIKITQEFYGKIVQKRVSEEMKRISRKI